VSLVIEGICYAMRSELKTFVLLELTFHRYERRSLLVTSSKPLLTERIKGREHRKGTGKAKSTI
jgi:hypothetical protein